MVLRAFGRDRITVRVASFFLLLLLLLFLRISNLLLDKFLIRCQLDELLLIVLLLVGEIIKLLVNLFDLVVEVLYFVSQGLLIGDDSLEFHQHLIDVA